MILTKEFLSSVSACKEGYAFVLQNGLINQDYDIAIQGCADNGQPDYAEWLKEQKSTAQYVRANGSVITVNAYQVFNPLTGKHTRYETVEEAKQGFFEIAKAVLETYTPTVVQEITNEKGDAAWEASTLKDEFLAKLKIEQ